MAVPGVVSFVEMCDEKLVVGYPSAFAVYNLGQESAPLALVNADDATLHFLLQQPVKLVDL